MKNFKGKYDKDNLQVNEKDFILARKNLEKIKVFNKNNTNKKSLSEYFLTKLSLPFKVFNFSQKDENISDNQIKIIKKLNYLDYKIFNHFNN